jgi:hypothetical protein
MTLPTTCSVCGASSSRWIQDDRGLALYCKNCEPTASRSNSALPRFNLPKLPARGRRRNPPRPDGTVLCTVEYTSQENENGFPQDCVIVTCNECGHTEESWGHGERSVRRCLALMAENCPSAPEDWADMYSPGNFYIIETEAS